MLDLAPAGKKPNGNQTPTVFIRRHTLVTRVSHWINAFSLCILLMSGLQIFNAHSQLYWGQTGQYGDDAAFAIEIHVPETK